MDSKNSTSKLLEKENHTWMVVTQTVTDGLGVMVVVNVGNVFLFLSFFWREEARLDSFD